MELDSLADIPVNGRFWLGRQVCDSIYKRDVLYNGNMEGVMNEKLVKVYTTSTWPWCRKAKDWLDANHIKYQELNVGTDQKAREEMVNITHQLAVPAIAIDGEYVIGFNEKALKEKLGIK